MQKVFKGFTPMPVSPSKFQVLSIYLMTYNTRFVFQTKKVA